MVSYYYKLKLDLDMRDARRAPTIVRRAGFLARVAEELIDFKITRVAVYRTRHGAHVVADILSPVEGLKNSEIVAMQAILGSDVMRELLNLRRTRQPQFEGVDAPWNVLFCERVKENMGHRVDRAKRRSSPELRAAFVRGLGRDPEARPFRLKPITPPGALL